MKVRHLSLGMVVTLTLFAACSTYTPFEPIDGASPPNATITFALNGNTHDVGGFHYLIECRDSTSHEQYVELQSGPIPDWLVPEETGDQHYFADLFLVLPPGKCKVEATPMINARAPSKVCSKATGQFEVLPRETTEIVLMAQCQGQQSGFVDIIAGLNVPPYLSMFQYDPGRYIYECQTVSLKADGHDPNGDDFEYQWSVKQAPPEAIYKFESSGNTATLFGQSAGSYLIELQLIDAFEASAVFDVWVKVLDDPLTDICSPDENVCCDQGGGLWSWMSAEECVAEGSVITTDELMCKPVCCELSSETLITEHGTCWKAMKGEVYPAEECELYCCLPEGTGSSYVYTIGTECSERKDMRLGGIWCEHGPTCCSLEDGTTGWLFTEDGCLQALHPDECEPY